MPDTAFEIIGASRPARWLITCDHASNSVPPDINGGTLGLPAADMARHIAYDIGAAGVTRHLADLLNARAILSRFSRLVIDPNRGEDDPTLLMRLYDGTIIPGNRHADATEIERRKTQYYHPYHGAYARLAARRADTIIVSIHSFTPRLNSGPLRLWHIGILFAGDKRLSDPLLARLAREDDICCGTNEPYVGRLAGDAVDRHALQHGRLNVLIELRNDLIRTKPDQHAWASRLAPILTDVLNGTNF